MAEAEIEIFKTILETQQPKRVMEWGSGSSTLYWPRFAPYVETWISVEHQWSYWSAVREALLRDAALCERVTLMYRPGDSYVTLDDIEEPFDLILVDGTKRRECLRAASKRLALRGIAVLHDAGRKAYLPEWEAFRHSELLYPGEQPRGDGDFRHRGLAVFWNDAYVKQAGWLRAYA